MTPPGKQGSSETSRWEQWSDIDGTLHAKITLTRYDQTALGPRFWEMMREAGLLIEAAFKEPD